MNWGEIWGAKEEPEFTPPAFMNLATHHAVPSSMNKVQQVYQTYVYVDLSYNSGKSVTDIVLELGGWLSDRDVEMILSTMPQFWQAENNGEDDVTEFTNRISLAVGSHMLGGAAIRAARHNMLYNIRSHIYDHIKGRDQFVEMAEKMSTNIGILNKINCGQTEDLKWEDVHELHNSFLERILGIAGAE